MIININGWISKIPFIKKIYSRILNIILNSREEFIVSFKNIRLFVNIKDPIDKTIFYRNKYEEKQIKFLCVWIKKNKPSVIIHLAAQPLVLESYKNPKYTFEVNVIGTSNVLEAAFKTNSTEVVLISTTDKVYENNNSGKIFSESDPLKGKDPYSASKVAAENVIYAWREIRVKNGGPALLTARAGNIIGGGDLSKNRLIPDLVRAFNSNSKLVIRNPSSSRPWQHVLDPLSGYLLMIDNAINGDNLEVLNFGPVDKSMKVKEVVKIASKNWVNNSLTFTLRSPHLPAQ
jgi:CDP-glucose 4,6-dehydratase